MYWHSIKTIVCCFRHSVTQGSVSESLNLSLLRKAKCIVARCTKQLAMRVAKRIPFYTNPCRRLPPKIPNPLPKTTSEPIHVRGGGLFYDLKAKCAPPPIDYQKLPPLLKNPIGKVILTEVLEEMRKLRQENAKFWTITGLSKKFAISRAYVIKNVLSDAERKLAQEELIERIDSLSLGKKRGWLTRYKIREHRRDIWN